MVQRYTAQKRPVAPDSVSGASDVCKKKDLILDLSSTLSSLSSRDLVYTRRMYFWATKASFNIYIFMYSIEILFKVPFVRFHIKTDLRIS